MGRGLSKNILKSIRITKNTKKKIIIYGMLFLISFIFGANLPSFLTYSSKISIIKNFHPKNPQNIKSQESTPEVFASTASPSIVPIVELLDTELTDKLIFISSGEIFTMDANRSNRTQITADDYQKFMFSVSPNKTMVAYAYIPKAENRRTNKGFIEGFHSGIAIYILTSKQTKILVPYGDRTQHYYPSWSSDNRYISVWSGNGKSAEIYDVNSGKLIKRYASDNELILVSPVVFLPKNRKISLIYNTHLVTANIDGSSEYRISDNSDAVRSTPESAVVPQPPLWSASGRFVIYYKNSNLVLYDTSVRNDYTLVPGLNTESKGLVYPQGFVGGFVANESGILFQDVSKIPDSMFFDINASASSQISPLGNAMIISPDSFNAAGISKDGKFTFFSFYTKTIQTCGKEYEFSLDKWWGQLSQITQPLWSKSNQAVLGQFRIGENQRKGLQLLILNGCKLDDLTNPDEDISEFAWF